MVFSSVLFLVYFLPIFLAVYFIADKKYKNALILSASLLFYSWGAPKFIFVLLISSIIDFYLVRKLQEATEAKDRKRLLIYSMVLNLGMLAYFKYSNFFVENFNGFLSNFGLGNLGWTDVVLPVGISFYTFQTLTYAVDVYRGNSKPLEKLSDYLLFVFSFPQMIAGPIVRYDSVANDIVNRDEKINDKLIGFYRFCIGLAKKVLIANTLAEQADIVFHPDSTNVLASTAWIGLLAFTFQIYFDFSGYSDMAVGLGRMLGFKFPENFDSPYIARSITEFWRRWHMTLGDFMKNYLYIPLGGNKVSTRKLYLNLIVVFVLSGFWHGAAWNFILWGIFHGVFLILDRIFLDKILQKIGKPLSILFTFFVVMIGFVMFRSEDVSFAMDFYSTLFSGAWDFQWLDVSTSFMTISVIAIIFSFIASTRFGSSLISFVYDKDDYHLRLHVVFVGISLVIFVLCLSILTTSNFNPFIYYRF